MTLEEQLAALQAKINSNATAVAETPSVPQADTSLAAEVMERQNINGGLNVNQAQIYIPSFNVINNAINKQDGGGGNN